MTKKPNVYLLDSRFELRLLTLPGISSHVLYTEKTASTLPFLLCRVFCCYYWRMFAVLVLDEGVRTGSVVCWGD